MKLGVFGGTFDPPHMGHMKSVRAAMDLLELDKLLLIPARVPPHKALPADSAPPEDRIAMTALMADGMGLKGRVETLDLELRRPGDKSYTVDTLETLRQQYPKDELWLLMGSDMLLTILDWHRPGRILELANIGAFARTRQDHLELLQRHAEALERGYGAKVRLLPMTEIIEVSSTDVRRALADGNGDGLLWKPVYGYILRHGCYGTHVDLKSLSDDQLRAVSQSMIKAKRIPHVLGTEFEAVRLAQRYGISQDDARRAAILHDCTKYLSLEEQLKLCAQYDILLDSLEKKSEKLLHAKTAAALADAVFGQRGEVVRAIAFHTTGRPDMSPLEKTLYLADYIEPNRDFDGLEELRKLAYEDLDKALLSALLMSAEELRERGTPIHPNTLEAIAWYQKVAH